MITEDKPDTRTSLWLAVGALTLAGLALRIAAAQGGLWTDEAWSMVYAQQARDPIGVFLRINHDNNHHLNSLWLQAVGMHASSVLMRAPAILAGSLMIPAAALLFAKRSAAAATAAAALFAFSPIMVTYGSEARGYAPMMLAVLLMVLLVAKGVEDRDDNRSISWLDRLDRGVRHAVEPDDACVRRAPDHVGLSREALLDRRIEGGSV